MSVSIPAKLTAGDTWSFTFVHADHSAPGWDASIYFENSAATFSTTAADDGSDHAFTIAAVTTAAIKPGRYKWTIRSTDGTTVTSVETGWLEVLVNPASAGTHDTRSWARRTLEAVERFLEGNASTAQAAMSIQGRSISRWSLVELRQWRTELRAEVRAEDQSENAGLGRNIKVRFVR